MKIYTSVTIDMTTMETLSEESFEYSGPVALLKGSGGGGGSGRLGFPPYVENFHQHWLLGGDDYDKFGSKGWQPSYPTLSELLAQAIDPNGNPYTNTVSFDPTTVLNAIESDFADFRSNIIEVSDHVAGVDLDTDIAALYDAVQTAVDALAFDSDTYINSRVDVFEKDQREDLTRALSRFRAGMADVGAVQTSAFAIGEALVEAAYARNIDTFRSSLRLQSAGERTQLIGSGVGVFAQTLLNTQALRLNVEHQAAEFKRMDLVTNAEWYDREIDLNIREATWPLEAFQPVANFLASPPGGTGIPSGQKGGSVRAIGSAVGSLAGGMGLAALMMSPPSSAADTVAKNVATTQ